jgi:hypothetical protein
MTVEQALQHFNDVCEQHNCSTCKEALDVIRAALAESTNSSHNRQSAPCKCSSCGSPVDMPLCDPCIRRVVIG